MSLIIRNNWKAKFSTLHGGGCIRHSALELLETCMTEAVEAAVTGPNAVEDLGAIQDIVSLFDLDVSMDSGAEGEQLMDPVKP